MDSDFEESSWFLCHSLPIFDFSSTVVRFVSHTQVMIEHVIEDLFEVLDESPLANGTDLNVSKKQEIGKSSTLNSELHNFVSKAKASFKETVNSLDLFEDFLNEPSEVTGKPLKQLFDRGKNTCKEPLTTDNIDEVLEFFRTFLVKNSTQVSENENKKSLNFNSDPITNKNLNNPDTNLLSSTPPNISAENGKFDFQNFEPNEESPRSTSEEKGQREIHQYDPTQNNDHEESDDLMTPSYEPKDVKHDSCETLTSKSTQITREKALDRPLGRIGKEVERKVHNQNFQILDKKVHSVKSWKTETRETPTTSRALEDEVHWLKVKNQELLAELGQIMVEKTAKEREARKSELFQRIYRPSSPQTNQSVVSTCNDKSITREEKLGCPNDNDNTLRKSSYVDKKIFCSEASGSFLKPQVTNENANPTSLVSKFTSNKQAAQAAELLVKENDHRPGKEEIVKNDEDERNLHDRDLNSAGTSSHNNENKNPTTENLPSIASKKKTSGGEGINQSGNVTGPSNEASASREGNIEQSLTRQIYESLSFSVQQDYSNEKEKISLSNVPPTSVETTLYNNYKLLLLSLGQMLLSSEVTKLINWATQNFPIVNPQNATHVLFQLDENQVINASDLSQLRHFFESIVRFDLVYVIDAFLLGDYGIFRQITASKKRDVNTAQTSQDGTTTRYQNLFNAASNSQFSLRDSSLTGENSNEPQRAVLQQKQQAFPTLVLNQLTPNDAKFVPRSPNENHSSSYGLQSLKSGAMGFTASQQVVADGHVTNERRTTTGNSSTNANSSATSNPRNTQTIGSNGSGLSTLGRNQEQSDNWLCSHYKRHCYVKFECCDQFWPCHRCHNNQTTCGRRLKSRDTQMVKCVSCNKVQQVGQYCCDCGVKFSEYYCGLCKHLTHKNAHPYHCEKCGICRSHGDRSFHCDTCGRCLDVQLRESHKCREGSGHDQCCICLEDMFTGCRILPCSHKIHKDCATQLIRSGITRCPICRESFAHKLKRRPRGK